MVKLYDKDGERLLAVVQPSACTVTENAGGMYSLSATFPCAEDERWKLVQPDTVLEVDVPPTHREGFMRGPTSWYKVSGSKCYLYTKLVNEITNYSNVFDPDSGTIYSVGDPLAYYVDDMMQSHSRNDDCVYNLYGHIAEGESTSVIKPQSQWTGVVAAACGQITQVNSAPLYENEISRYDMRSNYEYGFIWQPGNTLPALLPVGTTMTKIADYGQMFIQVVLTDGRTGYVSRRQVEYFSTRARQVRDDGFVDIPTGEWENGYIDQTGANTQNGNTRYLRTVDYIPVNIHTRLQYYTQANLALYVRCYGSDHSYIGVRGHADLNTSRTDTTTFISGTAYIRITMRVPSGQTISLPEDVDWYAAYELTDADWDYPPENITRQKFRITNIAINGATMAVQVTAAHISYDKNANMLGECSIQIASPETAVDIMLDAQLDRNAKIATNCSGYIMGAEWSYRNIVSALLDPDNGLVHLTNGRLVRNNDFFCVLRDNEALSNLVLRYGANLTGVTWTRDYSAIITRVYPIAKDRDGTTIYLPEVFINSPFAADYGAVRAEVLDTGLKVGDSQQQADGSTKVLTLADVQEQMRQRAQERFSVDAADVPRVELSVSFVLLGDTEEYAQYRGLQSVQMYDNVRVIHEAIGLDVTTKVIAYSWDVLTARFTSVTLSNVKDYGIRQTAGYEIGDKAVSLRTLTPELRSRLGI